MGSRKNFFIKNTLLTEFNNWNKYYISLYGCNGATDLEEKIITVLFGKRILNKVSHGSRSKISGLLSSIIKYFLKNKFDLE